MKQYKKKLFELFPLDKSGSDDSPKEIDDHIYLKIYDEVKNRIPFEDNRENCALARFLYAACVKFDRFSVPTPYFVDATFSRKKLEIFTRALIKSEGQITPNSALFLVTQIRADLYKQLDLQPSSILNIKDFENHLKDLKNIPSFVRSPDKQKEFNDEMEKINAIISGIEDHSLRTSFVFRIPYLLYESDLSIKLIWQGIDCLFTTKNTHFPNRETFVNFENPTLPEGATRWQSGETEVTILFSALVDGSIQMEPLQAHLKRNFNGKWPASFNYCYSILRDVFWRLRLENGTSNNIIPAPRDLSEIKSVISSDRKDSIEWIMRGSPAFGYRSIDKDIQIQEKDMDILKLPAMHLRYRSTAEMYLELGLMNEALFWLNAGIEAFFELRLNELAEDPRYKDLVNHLISPKSFWEDAKAIVKDQFPEIASQIIWPEKEVHNSMYNKLKYICKGINFRISKKQLLEKYYDVNKYRNDLFHGRSEKTLPVDIIKKAFEAFDFIVANFIIEES